MRESPLSSSLRSRNSAPSAANASTDEFRVCHLVINDWKPMVRHEERTKVGGLEQPRSRKAESFQHLVRAKVCRGPRKNRLDY